MGLHRILRALASYLCAPIVVMSVACSSSKADQQPSSGSDNPATSWGQIVLYASHFAGITPDLSAIFGDPAHPQQPRDCTSTSYGLCQVFDCAFTSSDAPQPDAASITVKTLAGRGGESTIMPSSNGHYVSTLPDLPDMTGGETLTFSATGYVVPGFTVDVTYPR